MVRQVSVLAEHDSYLDISIHWTHDVNGLKPDPRSPDLLIWKGIARSVLIDHLIKGELFSPCITLSWYFVKGMYFAASLVEMNNYRESLSNDYRNPRRMRIDDHG